MEEEDYKLTPSGTLGGKVSVSTYKFLGEFNETEDALKFIREDMERNKFYPSVWWISDHGNFWEINPEDGAEEVEIQVIDADYIKFLQNLKNS